MAAWLAEYHAALVERGLPEPLIAAVVVDAAHEIHTRGACLDFPVPAPARTTEDLASVAAERKERRAAELAALRGA